MDAAPEKGESVSKFSEIARILHSFNLSAPKIIDVNNKGALELIGKTIMRKPNFRTSNQELTV